MNVLAEAERLYAEHGRRAARARPDPGRIVLGGAALAHDEIAADAAREFGATFARTRSRDAARAAARELARQWVRNWNERGAQRCAVFRRGENHLAESTADGLIDHLWRAAE